MQHRQRRARRAAPQAVALLLLLAHLPQGCAVAETYRSGGSTAVIEQSGPSRTQVTRYPDGHRIVTRGGSGTDITVQRGPGGSGVDTSERLEAYSRFDWADDDRGEERFSSPWDGPDEGREAFRQRVLERKRLDACR